MLGLARLGHSLERLKVDALLAADGARSENRLDVAALLEGIKRNLGAAAAKMKEGAGG